MRDRYISNRLLVQCMPKTIQTCIFLFYEKTTLKGTTETLIQLCVPISSIDYHLAMQCIAPFRPTYSTFSHSPYPAGSSVYGIMLEQILLISRSVV